MKKNLSKVQDLMSHTVAVPQLDMALWAMALPRKIWLYQNKLPPIVAAA